MSRSEELIVEALLRASPPPGVTQSSRNKGRCQERSREKSRDRSADPAQSVDWMTRSEELVAESRERPPALAAPKRPAKWVARRADCRALAAEPPEELLC